MSVPESGKLYRFRCAGNSKLYDPQEATKYLEACRIGLKDIEEGDNVCLFEKQDVLNQVWKYQNSVLRNMRNTYYVLTKGNDVYDNVEAYKYKKGSENQEIEFIPTGKKNIVYIKLKNTELYLTASNIRNGSPEDRESWAHGNVYFGSNEDSRSDIQWEFTEITKEEYKNIIKNQINTSIPQPGKFYKFRCTGYRLDYNPRESIQYLEACRIGLKDIEEGDNVCLFEKQDVPNQVWKYQNSILKNMRNTDYALTKVENNVELCKVGSENQEIEFIPTGKKNIVFIRFKDSRLYLIANDTANGTMKGKRYYSSGNVSNSKMGSDFQEWEFTEITEEEYKNMMKEKIYTSVPEPGKLYKFRCTGYRIDYVCHESTKYLYCCTNKTLDDNNVCLFENQNVPNEVWRYENSVLKNMRYKNYALTKVDRNAEACKIGSENQEIEFIPTGKKNTVFIRFKDSRTYLKTDDTKNGTLDGKNTYSSGNVFPEDFTNNDFQEWEFTEIKDDITSYDDYKYGSIINPVTKEVYPITYFKNGTDYSDSDYKLEINKDENKPTHLVKTDFSLAKFIAGFEPDDSLINSDHPGIGGLAGGAIGVINSLKNSLRASYIDIDYYKKSSTGQKKVLIKFGNSESNDLLKDLLEGNGYVSKIHAKWSVKCPDLYNMFKDIKDINNAAKKEYGHYKGITPSDDYSYDYCFTIDKVRLKENFIGYILLLNHSVYVYEKLYNNEKLEIVVKEKGMFGKEIDRLNITPNLNPIYKVPDDISRLLPIINI